MKNKTQQIVFSTAVMVAISLSLTDIQVAQAANVKTWGLTFFGENGAQVGTGNFSYDLEIETYIPINPIINPFDGIFVNTALTAFSTNLFSLNNFSRSGTLWWDEAFLAPRTGALFNNFGWVFQARDIGNITDQFLIQGSGGTGTWMLSGINVGERQGTWVAYAIPEPLTILGTATATGFSILFKRQVSQKLNKEKQQA